MTDHGQPAIKPQITFGKFENVDLRVARVESATMAQGTRFPCRVLELDVGALGRRRSVGQFALVEEDALVGTNVIACVNLAPRDMGPYVSEALVLGAPHPESPPDQSQATPLGVASHARPGDRVF